jgi:tellurite resistance-related uncharacterized protein
MNNEGISAALRKYVQNNLTPTQDERSMVEAVYAAVCSVLGRDRCYRIGSYPRYTAIRPPHDLDVLYSADKWSGAEPNAAHVVADIKGRIEKELVSPPGLSFTVTLQTHSVTISFTHDGEEVFAVDVVPAWTTGSKNKFGDDIYRVPEIILKGHRRRVKTYKRLAEQGGHIHYILSDPKGYTSVAAGLNKANPDFRKSVKLPKKWKQVAKQANDEFKLKSFHIEQIITSYFSDRATLEILEAVTQFFVELPQWISHSQIPDRADPTRNIDAYVDELTASERAAILDARDAFFARLRSFDGSQDAEVLFETKPVAAAAQAIPSAVTAASATITERSRVTPRSSFGTDP